jgi:hypothetical protein
MVWQAHFIAAAFHRGAFFVIRSDVKMQRLPPLLGRLALGVRCVSRQAECPAPSLCRRQRRQRRPIWQTDVVVAAFHLGAISVRFPRIELQYFAPLLGVLACSVRRVYW